MLLRLLGCLLLALALVDVFETVLLPSARGVLSRIWVGLLWRVATLLPGRIGAAARPAAGPLSIVATIAGWVVLLWFGFALLYLPDVGELGYSSDVQFQGNDLVAALYLSGTVLTTLGLGDVAAQTDGLRLLVVLESACGLAVFTAALGYLPAIYTVVTELRVCVEAVADLQVTSGQRAVEVLDENAVMTIEAVRRDVIAARQHLLRFPVLHWFHPPTGQSVMVLVEGASLLWLAARLGYGAERHPAVQRHAVSLELALRRLVEDTQRQVGGEPTDEGRALARQQVERVREAVRDLDPERAAGEQPPDEAIDDLARVHAVLVRYADAHGYDRPSVV